MHFLPVMSKSLHVTLENICMAVRNVAGLSHHCLHCWNVPPTASLCSHSLFGFQQCSANINECQSQWMPFFPRGGNQWHTFTSSTLSCQTPFCQIALLLPSVTWQQNVLEYWWESSTSNVISPASVSDVMGKHNKIGGIIFSPCTCTDFEAER